MARIIFESNKCNNIELEERDITIDDNGTYAITPNVGYAGMSKVDVNVGVDTLQGLNFAGVYDAEQADEINQYYKDAIEYAEEIKNNWTNPENLSSSYQRNTKIVFFPEVDTSNATNMSSMFYSCSALTTIPQLDTSNVTSMSSMFRLCSALTTIPQLDTSNVTSMNYMFGSCSALTTIPQLDTSNVTNMGSMFYSCSALTTIPQLDTSKATNMSDMFYSCSALTTIPQLDTSKATNMSNMFYNCSALENLGGFVNCKVSLSLSSSSKLTHQSLMNVINNLYDLTANGLSEQTLTIGNTNLAKLTADEIAIATNKGWTIK